MGFRIPHGKGQFWGKGLPIVKYRDFLPWAVQKCVNRWICHLCCGLRWAEGSMGSIVFARLRLCAQFQSYSIDGANVPKDTVQWTMQKRLNRSICRLGCGLIFATRQVTLAPSGEYNWTIRLQQRCGLMSNYFDHLLYFRASVVSLE